MKTIHVNIKSIAKSAVVLCLSSLTLASCNDFLGYTPTAVVDEDKAYSDPDGMVTSAYAMLGDCWYTYPFNLWPYGDLASDDCLKGGSGTTDTDYHSVAISTSFGTASIAPYRAATARWYRLTSTARASLARPLQSNA